MVGRSLLLICSVVGLAVGNFIEVPQCRSSILSSGFISNPVVADTMYRSNYMSGAALANAITSDGPETPPLPVIQAPSVTLPAVEGPILALPSPPIPAPRVISQRCVCTKTVVKPQVIQRQVTVPKVQRYLKRTYTPTVENLTYKSRPIGPANRVSSVAATSAVTSNSLPYRSGNYYASRVC